MYHHPTALAADTSITRARKRFKLAVPKAANASSSVDGRGRTAKVNGWAKCTKEDILSV